MSKEERLYKLALKILQGAYLDEDDIFTAERHGIAKPSDKGMTLTAKGEKIAEGSE